MVAKLTNLDRFAFEPWSGLHCPEHAAWRPACIDGNCTPASLSSAGSAIVERTGKGPKTCIPRTESSVAVGVATQSIAGCLGTELPAAAGSEIYLFATYYLPVTPTAAVVTTDGSGYEIFLRADLTPARESVVLGENDTYWTLIQLDPPAGGPAEPTFHAYLGWIDPVQ